MSESCAYENPVFLTRDASIRFAILFSHCITDRLQRHFSEVYIVHHIYFTQFLESRNCYCAFLFCEMKIYLELCKQSITQCKIVLKRLYNIPATSLYSIHNKAYLKSAASISARKSRTLYTRVSTSLIRIMSKTALYILIKSTMKYTALACSRQFPRLKYGL